MKKRNTPKEKTERVQRERDPIPWRYCLLTLVCGLLLVAGFFWAARHHFSAIDYGMKNAKLREQKKGLEDEQRRLYLSKETLLSPTEIKKLAKKIGLQDLTVQSLQVISPPNNGVKTPVEKANNETPKQAFLEKTVKSQKAENSKVGDKVKDKSQTLTTNSRPQMAKK